MDVRRAGRYAELIIRTFLTRINIRKKTGGRVFLCLLFCRFARQAAGMGIALFLPLKILFSFFVISVKFAAISHCYLCQLQKVIDTFRQVDIIYKIQLMRLFSIVFFMRMGFSRTLQLLKSQTSLCRNSASTVQLSWR